MHWKYTLRPQIPPPPPQVNPFSLSAQEQINVVGQLERIYSLLVWTLIHKFVNFTQIEVRQWVFIFVAAVAIATVML